TLRQPEDRASQPRQGLCEARRPVAGRARSAGGSARAAANVGKRPIDPSAGGREPAAAFQGRPDARPLKPRGERMNTPARLRRIGICVLLIATLGLAAYAGSARAEAVPSTYDPPPRTDTNPDTDLCTGLSGITTGTTTEHWRFVNGADGTTHVHLT